MLILIPASLSSPYKHQKYRSKLGRLTQINQVLCSLFYFVENTKLLHKSLFAVLCKPYTLFNWITSDLCLSSTVIVLLSSTFYPWICQATTAETSTAFTKAEDKSSHTHLLSIVFTTVLWRILAHFYN